MRKFHLALVAAVSTLAIAACQQSPSVAADDASASSEQPFNITEVAKFDFPWAMTFLPGEGGALVTEKSGALKWLHNGQVKTVAGTPSVVDDGQGGFGDVVLSPDYAQSGKIYLSWVEAGDGGKTGSVVAHAKVVLDANPRLEGLTIIWRQDKVEGDGHFSQRLAFSPDGKYLFVTSGERQKFKPSQDLKVNLGKVLRLTPDGKAAPGNPFAGKGGNSDQIWSLGHRNLLGIAFAPDGRLWEHEMGPQGGDEVNLIIEGKNYGYPIVSNGDHYGGADIPDHPTRPEFEAPKVFWNPSIAPAGLIVYSGNTFPQWKGDIFMGALAGESLIRIDLDGESAKKGDRWAMGARIREVEQGPDGAIYVLEDGASDPGGRLLKLTPKP